MSALYYTLLIAILSSVIATVIGLVASIGIFHMKKLPQSMVLNLNYIPILNPDIVTGISLMVLFISMKMNLGFATMLLAHITFNIPYVILSILPKLKQMNKHLYEAALDLGASPVEAFWKVILPEIMPVSLPASRCFAVIDDFVISFHDGFRVNNLPLSYLNGQRGISPKINVTTVFLSVLILLIIVNLRMSVDNPERRENGRSKENGRYLPGSQITA